ncbi:MAG: hypothetical protein JWP99_1678 [Devosia sp.]|nr:hypothetical protein [Devosia sp.]
MNGTRIFFEDWHRLVRTALVGSVARGTPFLFLPNSGKRTAPRLVGFDLVVVVALRSALRAIALAKAMLGSGGTLSVSPRSAAREGSA